MAIGIDSLARNLMLQALLLFCAVSNQLTKIKVASKVCNILLRVNIYRFLNCVALCRIAPSSVYEFRRGTVMQYIQRL